MSSIGARSAEIFVMQKRQKEKMKRMEEERIIRGKVSVDHQKIKVENNSSTIIIGKSKVHPGNEQGVASNSA